MDPKKSIKADLNKYGSLFVFVGLLVMSAISYAVLNHKSTTVTYQKEEEEIVYDIESAIDIEIPEEEIPEDKPEPVETPPVEIPPIIEEIKVVEDVVETTFEADPNPVPPPPPPPPPKPITGVKPGPPPPPPPIAKEPETSDVEAEISYNEVTVKPVFPGCEGKTGDQLNACNAKVAGQEVSNRMIDPRDGDGRVGKAYIGFTIDQNGQVTNVVVKRSAKDKELDKAAVNGVKAMWSGKRKNIVPGKNALGKPVKVTYMVPVTFSPPEE